MRISDWSSDVCSSDLSLPTPPSDKAGWVPVTDEPLPAQAWAALGLRRIGGMAVRVDRLERLTATLRALARKGPFPATTELAAMVGCGETELAGLLPALVFRPLDRDHVTTPYVALPPPRPGLPASLLPHHPPPPPYPYPLL